MERQVRRNRRQRRAHTKRAVEKFKPLLDIGTCSREKAGILRWLTSATDEEIRSEVYWLHRHKAVPASCARAWGCKV